MSSRRYALADWIYSRCPDTQWMQSLLQQLFKLFIKPLFLVPNIESSAGLEKSLSSACCVGGRPLGENNTYPHYLKSSNTEMRTVSLAGSRAGCPINTTALGVVLRNWNESLDIVKILRGNYLRRAGLSPPLSYIDLSVLSQMGLSVPAFLLRRSDNPLLSGQLPAQVATTYKIVAGLNKLTNSLIAHAVPIDKILSSQDLFEHAEKYNIFLSPGGTEACGAPEKLIYELLEVMVNEPARVDQPFPDALRHVIPDTEPLIDYAMHCAELHFATRYYTFEIEKAVLSVIENCRGENHSDAEISEQLRETLYTPHAFRIYASAKVLWAGLERIGIDEGIVVQLEGNENKHYVVENYPRASLEYRERISMMLEQIHSIIFCASIFINRQQSAINQTLGQVNQQRTSVLNVCKSINAYPVLKILGMNRVLIKRVNRDYDKHTGC